MYYFSPYYNQYYMPVNVDYNEVRSSSSSPFFTLEEAFVKGNLLRNQYRPYKSFTQYMPIVKGEKEQLLLELMMGRQYLLDLVLYLDIFPTDMMALSIYNQTKTQYQQLEKEYQSKYGSLCPISDTVQKEFGWTKTKSPWIN